MRNRQKVDKPGFAFIEVSHLMEIKQPEKLPANFSKLAAGAPSSTTSYAMIRGNRTTSRQIMNIKEEIMQIREVLSNLQETASSKEEGDFMYEQKEIIEKIDQVKDKVSGLETSIALIEERTRKLDSIEQTLSELNDKISAEVVSKDLVHKDIEHLHTKIDGQHVILVDKIDSLSNSIAKDIEIISQQKIEILQQTLEKQKKDNKSFTWMVVGLAVAAATLIATVIPLIF